MGLSPGAALGSKIGAVLRELALAITRALTSGLMVWIVYVSITQMMAVVPNALTAAILGPVIQLVGRRAPWVAVICVVLWLWWLQVRARAGNLGVLHGLQVWLLQHLYSWSVLALLIFAIVVVSGTATQSIVELRWLRDAVFLAADISVLIACRIAYQRTVRNEAH
jgi:hypothetical protein